MTVHRTFLRHGDFPTRPESFSSRQCLRRLTAMSTNKWFVVEGLSVPRSVVLERWNYATFGLGVICTALMCHGIWCYLTLQQPLFSDPRIYAGALVVSLVSYYVSACFRKFRDAAIAKEKGHEYRKF